MTPQPNQAIVQAVIDSNAPNANAQKELAAAAAVISKLTPQEVMALHFVARQAQLRADEDAKPHPLAAGFEIPAKLFDDLCVHILDGGGVTEDEGILQDFLQAAADRDQAKLWPLLIHIVKARAKINGIMRPLPNGGVSFTGVRV